MQEKNYYKEINGSDFIYKEPLIINIENTRISASSTYFLPRKKGQCILCGTSTLANEYNARDYNVWSLSSSSTEQNCALPRKEF